MTSTEHLNISFDEPLGGGNSSLSGWVRWLRAGGQLDEWTDNTWSDIQFASQILMLGEGERLLNLSCGWGRHAIALAHYGVKVIGLDSSADLLDLARETSSQAGVQVTWLQGGLDEVILTEPVDAIVQFNANLLERAESPAEALFVLDQIHALLKDDGRFLFGSTDWDSSPPLQAQSLSESSEATETNRRYFDPESRIVDSQTVILDRDGRRREYWRRTWHPSRAQMAALLLQAGFEIEGQFNDFSFLPYDPELHGLVWLARKA
jgi:cyclopropane fatty-acyl-phospholipid synthase-like methyltransferase